jgi:magnesium transporter
MLTYYKNTENGLEKFPEAVPNCWVNVVDPTQDEIAELAELGLPHDLVTYSLDMDERPRTQKEDDGTLLILIRIPYFQGVQVDVPYTTIPLGIVLTQNQVVTICRKENEIMQEFSSGRAKGLSTGKRYRFVLRILHATANRYLAYLREINRVVDAIEDRIPVSSRNREVLELLKFQKSLVYFTTALRSNELTMERLQRWQIFKLYPEDEDLLEDVITENQQAIEMVGISANILNSVMDTFATIVSNNLNVVMKFLASVTIVMSVPTIVTSFFGMNVDLPFAEHPLAYLFIILLFLAISGLVVFLFMKRDWF